MEICSPSDCSEKSCPVEDESVNFPVSSLNFLLHALRDCREQGVGGNILKRKLNVICRENVGWACLRLCSACLAACHVFIENR